MFRISLTLLTVSTLAGCQSLGTDRAAIEKQLGVRLTCEALRRVEVTPNDLDKLSPSTRWEIETNPLYQEALKCRRS